MQNNDVTISVFSNKIIKFLTISMIVLLSLHVIFKILMLITGYDSMFGIIPLFDIDLESNFPSFFSTILLLFSAFLLYLISIINKKNKNIFSKKWFFLSIIFLYLSIDENISLHELLIYPMAKILKISGNHFFIWSIPVIFILVLIILYFMKFWLTLPKKTKYGILIAALIYISGAIGFEVLGFLPFSSDNKSIGYLYYITVFFEELLEMSGIIIFIRVLLNHLEYLDWGIYLKFKNKMK